jgi:uncharacterized protein (DUF924 family)
MVEPILDFWFGERARPLWFATDPAFDAEIRSRFATTLLEAASHNLDHWSATADGALALIIVLDQFPRNLHRGSARAFAHDAKARALAERAIAAGFDRAVPLDRRRFIYLPFQHSEDLADQERSVELFSQWADEHPVHDRAGAQEEMTYVHAHHEAIRRFGRFPYRNAALGRTSTPAELAYLAAR